MAQAIKVGIIGAGWPGVKHAEGYRATSGFQVAAVSDLIPSRRKALAQQAGTNVAEHADYEAILKDANIAAVSIAVGERRRPRRGTQLPSRRAGRPGPSLPSLRPFT